MTTTLLCTVCGLEKPPEEFEIDRRNTRRRGRATRCRSCHSKSSAESKKKKRLAELEQAWRELLQIPPEEEVFRG